MGLKQRGKQWYVRFRTWQEFGPSGFMRAAGDRKNLAQEIEFMCKRLRQTPEGKAVLRSIDTGKVGLIDYYHTWNPSDPRPVSVKNKAFVRELYDQWITYLRAPNTMNRRGKAYSPRTVFRYENSWNRFFELLHDNATLAELDKAFLRRYEAKRVQQPRGATAHVGKGPVSASSWNNDMIALQAFVRWVREYKDLDVPDLPIKKKKQPKKIVRWLAGDEIAALEEFATREEWAFYALLMGTGLRFSEAANVRPCDLVDGEVLVRKGKTARSTRRVPVMTWALRVLTAHIARMDTPVRSRIFDAYDDPNVLKRVRYERWRYRWVRLVEKAELVEPVTMHDLRDTFAVYCRKAGVSLEKLQQYLGHESFHMTVKYASYDPDQSERRRDMDAAGKLMQVGTKVGTGRKRLSLSR